MNILFLTDLPARTDRLVRSLPLLGPSRIVDVLDPFECVSLIDPACVRAIISDVALGRSEAVAALRTYLSVLQAPGRLFICVLHDPGPRAWAQAQALRPTHLLPVEGLAGRLALVLNDETPVPASHASVPLARRVAAAGSSLTRLFALGRAGEVVNPGLIATGAAYIETALREADIRTWLDLVWQLDDVTHQHCLIVAGLAAGFAQQLGFSASDCQRLTQAALLHDIGKSRIPLAILKKPDRLDEAERKVMQNHPIIGYELLQQQGHADEMLTVVRSHHELLDGSGYPDRLRGREISDLVRLVTICDIFGALIERRPYKAPMDGIQAHDVLARMEGRLDQALVRAFKPLASAASAVKLGATA